MFVVFAKGDVKVSLYFFPVLFARIKESIYLYPNIFYYSPSNVNIMASRRELFTECLINSMFIPGTDKAKADELMAEVLKMQDEFLSRISHTEPGNVKGFYKKFRADFNAKINEIIDGIGKLN